MKTVKRKVNLGEMPDNRILLNLDGSYYTYEWISEGPEKDAESFIGCTLQEAENQIRIFPYQHFDKVRQINNGNSILPDDFTRDPKRVNVIVDDNGMITKIHSIR